MADVIQQPVQPTADAPGVWTDLISSVISSVTLIDGAVETEIMTEVLTRSEAETEEEIMTEILTQSEAGSWTGSLPTRFNLGALTTTFEVPPSMSSCDQMRFMHDLTTMASVSIGVDCDYQIGPDCFPGVFAQVYNDDRNDNVDAVYRPAVFSPGNICPQGYVTACSYERVAGESRSSAGEWSSTWLTTASADIWDYLEDGETAIGCCPSGYECPTSSPTLCYSVVPSPGTLSVVSYSDDSCISSSFVFSFDSDQASESYTRTTTEPNMFGLVVHAPRVVLVNSEAVTTTDASDAPTTATTGSGGPEETGGPSPGEEGNDGLSSGAKIAIGLGAVVLVAVIAGVVWFVLRRRRKAAAAKAAADAEDGPTKGDAAVGALAGGGPSNDPNSKAELHGTSTGLANAAYGKPELDSVAVSELHGSGNKDKDGQLLNSELPGDMGTDRTFVAELPDSQATGPDAAAGLAQSQGPNTRRVGGDRDEAATGLWDWSQPLEGGSPAVSPPGRSTASPGVSSAVSPDETWGNGRR